MTSLIELDVCLFVFFPTDLNEKMANLLLQYAMMMLLGNLVCCNSVDDCPVNDERCKCLAESVVDCRLSGLTDVPALQAPENASMIYEELQLSDNNIQNISARAFGGVKFKVIEMLNNDILTVDKLAFVGLEDSLIELSLKLHESAIFPHDALQRLRALRSLTVANFGQTFLPQNALENLTNLENLTLSNGKLTAVTPDTLRDQASSLQFLGLYDNDIAEFPTQTIASLTSLKRLELQANSIQRLGKYAVSSESLVYLDLSRHSFQSIDSIDEDAFVGVAKTLQTLIISNSYLDDRHVPALAKITSLVTLDVSHSRIANIQPLFASLPLLAHLNVKRNVIDKLTRRSFQNANNLQQLFLDNNTFAASEPDAFRDLANLRELSLKHTVGLTLNADSFVGQQTSLRSLTLDYVDLSSVQWSPFVGLANVRRLSLIGCRLENIPEMTFANSRQLEALLLDNNLITELRQRSLIGVGMSLISLLLSSNRLSTIDQCAFYRFEKLTATSVFISNNPLQCDCNVKWMYDWLKSIPSTDAQMVDWRCSDGRQMSQIGSENFTTCNSSSPGEQVCEDWTLTTTDSSNGVAPTSGRVPPSSSALLSFVIVGAAIGSLVVLVGIPVTVCCCVITRKAKKHLELKEEPPPAISAHTKRFKRPVSFSNSLGVDGKQLTDGHRLHCRSVDALQPDDAMALLTLLRQRQQAASLNDLDIIRYTPAASAAARPYIESEIYDEIDDEKVFLKTETEADAESQRAFVGLSVV